MKVSLNTVKQYIDFELPAVDELVKRINEQLGGVEEIIDLGAKYKDAVIAKVVKCEKHPNADKLSVCEIDAGAGENVQVVCGASNVREGLFVVWLPPKSIVPATFDDVEPFVLEPKELRGVVSHGMIASAKELGIGDSHEGILELSDYDVHQGMSLVPGASFAELFGLNDTVIDIENKMFTHRPDLFGQLGIAREISGILHKQFEEPEWYWGMREFEAASGLELNVQNDAKESVSRFMAVAVKDVDVKPSPLWLQCALVVMGGKPINNIVDITNYIMLLTAQPTHAYDYDKIRGHKLGVRMAKKGEKAELLNGKTYELTEDDIVIADGEGVIGLGGIMGGGNCEVSAETRNIVLEVANFDMYIVRRSSMRHGLFTDALTRFNKGQSPLQNDKVMGHLLNMMMRLAGGEQASGVFDDRSTALDKAYEAQSLCEDLRIEADFINQRLGLSLPETEMEQLLRNVRFACYIPDGETATSFTAPFWRTDIELPEDIVEEVGRLYGFDKLPRELPRRSMKPAAKNKMRELKQLLRENLAKPGANEVLTYSFVHEKVLRNAGQDPSHAYRLSNALSPDLQYYRLSLMPSLLDKVQSNYRAGHDKFAIFEIGKTHFKGEMDTDEPSVPNEDDHIALVLAHGDKQKPAGAPFYAVRRYLEQIVDISGVSIVALKDFDLAKDEWGAQLVAAYDKNRSAVIVKDDQIWGVFGEFAPKVRAAFKLPEFAAGFELHLDVLNTIDAAYKPLSRFPKVAQDVSLIVSSGRSYETVYKQTVVTLSGLVKEDTEVHVQPVSIYQAENDKSKKTITLRITVTNFERTLVEDEVTAFIEKVRQTVED